MHVPGPTVAVSDTFYVGTPININTDTITTPTIFFIVDHSGSMTTSGNGWVATDPRGYRFTVTSDLMDSLQGEFPRAEIGLSVFNECLYYYYPDDPDYFTILPNQWTPIANKQGAYIPLYQIDSAYGPLSLKGYEICQKYLETWDRGTYVDLTYYPNYDEWGQYMSASTNINAGFMAAKHAMLSSDYPKSHHFIIFLSDGIANMPNDNTMEEYVKAIGTPTTFTVYFSHDSLAPGKLLTMTENVKVNGYSQSNKWSNIWAFYNTDYDKLMNMLYSNVIGLINSILNGSPYNIVINGIEVGDTTWYNNQAFIFTDMIPLTGWETDFACNISYHIKKDTAIGDTVITLEYDDTLDVNYVVKIDTTIDSMPPKFIVRYWDRKVEFYYNNAVITGAYEKMGALDLRFTEFMIDILYGYKDVSLELTNATRHEFETVQLNDAGGYLTNSINIRALNTGETPTSNNGTLELNFTDSIIAVFRNKKLPLDTVYVSIPFIKDNVIKILSADYHDEKLGDGLIDSIFLTYESDNTLTQAHITEILPQLTLPPWRNLTILSSSFTDSTISLVVSQDPSTQAVTFVTNQDTLRVIEKILNAGGMLFAAAIPIGDKIPPLTEAAHLVDYWDITQNDVLTVAFSEKIDSVDKNRPFFFKSMAQNGLIYYADMTLTGSQDSIMVFTVQSITGVSGQVNAMMAGDSVWISADNANVNDILNNLQDHPNNRRCVLTVERENIPLTITSADYYDEKSGDGLIDSLAVAYTCAVALTQNHINEVVSQLTLPPWRQLQILSSGAFNNGIALNVRQNSTDTVTFVTIADVLIINEKIISFDGVWNIKLQGDTISIGDRIPPLIEATHFVDKFEDTEDDLLTVAFSEKIQPVNTSRPFYFKSMDPNTLGAIYYGEMSLSDNQDSTMVFKVLSITGVQQTVDNIIAGDSIWISTDADNVQDVLANLQDHPNNRRRVISVDRELAPYTLVAKAHTPISISALMQSAGPKINQTTIDKLDSDNNAEVTGNGNSGVLLRIVPEKTDKLMANEFELSGSLTIFDALGNQLVKERTMGYRDDNFSLNFVWNCKNRNSRYVGSGTYLVIFKVTSKQGPALENVTDHDPFRLLIGVKE
jgi:hypothetical protein